jgi:aminoglycoside phosphotransferase (APT) family kinase protein
MTSAVDFETEALQSWLTKQNTLNYGPLSLKKFAGGQSNPTYEMHLGNEIYALRRKPFGDLLPSAHAIEREFQIISALYPTNFPVPKPYCFCESKDVIGAPFYIMQAVQGTTYWNGALPQMQPSERRAHYFAMIETMAKLHQINPDAIGLSNYGKAGNYFQRQIERWTKQYRASQTDELAAMEALIEWLPASMPEQTHISIVHGDYRIDNLIFDLKSPEVLAVLDWELSTLGDPLADLTYFLMNWIMPHEGQSGIGGLDHTSLGIPTLSEALSHYCRLIGREPLESLDWYFAYNLFRITAILQGVKKRSLQGNASSPKALIMAQKIEPLSSAALGFAKSHGLKIV